MKISVLICTFNRGNLINDTLHSLIETQTLFAHEIIVVNGGGANPCDEILNHWKARCPYLREIKTENINLANSRNVGLAAVGGDIVLMTDDDARVFPDWIAQMVKAHEIYQRAGCIGGEVVDASGDSFLSRIADVVTFPKYSHIERVRNVPGVNCSYKRDAIQAVGLQDLQMFRGEDVDYNWRVKKAGWEVLYIPSIKVYHAHRPTWKGLFNQHFMYGKAYYRVRSKWPDMYCAYPRSLTTPRLWAKGVYYLISPLISSFKKVKTLSGREKLMGYFIVCAIGYYAMYGTLLQYREDKASA